MSPIDLRDYFPASNSIEYRGADGAIKTRYVFDGNPTGFQSLYDNLFSLSKPGHLHTWKKDYWKNGGWCTATYAVLFMGDDGSVTEVGDWMSQSGCTPNVAFGYKTALSVGANTGLSWSPAGGLSEVPDTVEMFTADQTAPGSAYATNGHKCYSRTGLIEHMESYTLPYGRNEAGEWEAGAGKTYTDVVHIVMYHGTRAIGANPPQIRCGLTQPVAAHGAYYQSFKDYNSYAMELWLAKGVGIIQENTPFIEDGAYWGIPNCGGQIFDPIPERWHSYADI